MELVAQPVRAKSWQYDNPRCLLFTKSKKNMAQDYYVFAPFEILSRKELNERKSELLRDRRKCIAIVFNCESYEECSDRYFAHLETYGIESPCLLRATMMID